MKKSDFNNADYFYAYLSMKDTAEWIIRQPSGKGLNGSIARARDITARGYGYKSFDHFLSEALK